MAYYRVTTIDEDGFYATDHRSEAEAYETRVTPNELAGIPVMIEQAPRKSGPWAVYEYHNDFESYVE